MAGIDPAILPEIPAIGFLGRPDARTKSGHDDVEVKSACFLPSKSAFGRNRTAVGQSRP
jgi:hypothetical protein